MILEMVISKKKKVKIIFIAYKEKYKRSAIKMFIILHFLHFSFSEPFLKKKFSTHKTSSVTMSLIILFTLCFIQCATSHLN
jgi:hypothetical protein